MLHKDHALNGMASRRRRQEPPSGLKKSKKKFILAPKGVPASSRLAAPFRAWTPTASSGTYAATPPAHNSEPESETQPMNRPLRSVLLRAFLPALLLCGSLNAAHTQTPHPPAPDPQAQSTTAEKQAADWYQKGMVAAQANDVSKTIDCFEKSVTLAPTNVTYSVVLSRAMIFASQFAQTEVLLQDKIKTFPKPEDQTQLQIALEDVYYSWAVTLQTNYHFEEAITRYQEALKIDHMQRPPSAAIELSKMADAYNSLKSVR